MKLNRSTTETIVIILLAILAVLAIVSILWAHDPAAASGTVGNGHTLTIKPAHVYPVVSKPTFILPTWTAHRPSGGTTDTANACHTYLMGGRFGSVDNMPAVACDVPTVATVTKSAPEASYMSSNTAIVEQMGENVAVVTKETVAVTERVHCNNGNGNGSEGCNASEHGNQDETQERGDKADGRETGNSAEEHGNNSNGNGDHGSGGNSH